MTIPFAKSGLKRAEVLENIRKSIVTAIKRGSLFVLYLGAASIEHADWKKKLCKKVRVCACMFVCMFACMYVCTTTTFPYPKSCCVYLMKFKDLT